MSDFNTWLRAALCCCTWAAVDIGADIGTVDAAQPLPPIAPYRAAPSEKIPAPTAAPSANPLNEPPTPEDPAGAKGPPAPPPQRSLSTLSIDIRPIGEAPPNAAATDHYLAADETLANERGWNETLYFWQASNMAHRPLYFEQAYVERYGYNYGRLQPVASGVQFFGTVPLLPLKCAVRRPGECVWTLGYDRPGSDGVPCPRY